MFDSNYLIKIIYLYSSNSIPFIKLSASKSKLGYLFFPLNEEKFTMPSEFLSRIDKSINIIEQTKDRHHVVWGAASKGVLFALHLQRRDYLPDLAIDINPAKQDKYLPATGLHVLSPESAFDRLCPGDVIFVMNPNYLDEITHQGGSDYEYYLP